MYLKPIVEMDIFKIIDKFNPNKGVGNDNIGDFIVKKKKKKKTANEIMEPLTMIFNLSISTGIVPKNLKIAKAI